jgi:hypothetical protein
MQEGKSGNRFRSAKGVKKKQKNKKKRKNYCQTSLVFHFIQIKKKKQRNESFTQFKRKAKERHFKAQQSCWRIHTVKQEKEEKWFVSSLLYFYIKKKA